MHKLALIALLALVPTAGPAAQKTDAVKPVNTTKAGLALHGYDAVAYFTDQKARKGSDAYTHEWNGATWQFASAANRDRFAADPQAYAPQFGGYCAWAVSRNYTADVDPQAFEIVDGRLYLNYSRVVQLRWKLDRAGNIARADQNWPGLLGEGKH